MFLCALDGKLYSDDAIPIHIVLKQKEVYGSEKEIKLDCCCLCYGLINTKYKALENNNFEVPQKEKVKYFKISSTSFENKNDAKTEKALNDKPETKKITDILTVMLKDEKNKGKKSKANLQ